MSGKRFKLVEAYSKVEWKENGVTEIFSSGEAAAQQAAYLNRFDTRFYQKIKWQPRPVKTDEDWRKREMLRFKDGTYTKVPWEREAWWRKSKRVKEHFAHLSVKDPGMVAYTKDIESGECDIQSRLSIGGYLHRFFPYMSNKTVQKWVGIVAAKHEGIKLGFAKTQKQIRTIYTRGPRSCMSSSMGKYSSGRYNHHPVDVYAGSPDVAVAYLTKWDARTKRNKYVARCVVWPKKKIYTRVYGDSSRMIPLLTGAGYKSGSLTGARLKRIPADNGRFVMPFLDTDSWVDDKGMYLVVAAHGRYFAQNTSGLTGRA